MPMPLPAYTPPELADAIAAGGFAGLKDFALSKGLSATRLNKLFGPGRHTKIAIWVQIARFACMPLDDVYKAAKAGKLEKLIDRLLWERGQTIAGLEAEMGIGRDVLRSRVTRYDSIATLEKYADTARRLDWTLDKLAATMLRTENRKAAG